jgi:hypothetical protein
MKPNQINDKFFLWLVETNQISVSINGDVFNLNTGKAIGFVTGGYKRINMYGKTMAVNRLVYLVHKKSEIAEDFVIDHLDGNKLNNNIDNLEAVSYSQNNSRAFTNGRKVDLQHLKEISNGSKNGMAKLNCNQVKEARMLYKAGVSIKTIAKELNILEKTASQMVRGITYKDC